MSGAKITVMAPCKLNLYLDITGRRDDGYHNIDSIMQTVSLYNKISVVRSRPGIRIFCDSPGVPTDGSNTAYKAAALFAEALGREPDWDIHIKKAVPHMAGLGSSSADAAGTLTALNALCGLPLDEDELIKIAAKVGADVPFLLSGGTMRATGIGDELERLPNIEGAYFVVIMGKKGCSTPEIYGRFDKQEPPGVFLPDGLIKAIEEGRPGRAAKHLANRLEYCLTDLPIAEQKHVLLSLGAAGAAMTGAGSAVFGMFLNPDIADHCAKALAARPPVATGPLSYIATARPIEGGPVVVEW